MNVIDPVAVYENAPNATYGSPELFEFATTGGYDKDFFDFLQRLLNVEQRSISPWGVEAMTLETHVTRVIAFNACPATLRYLFEMEDGRVVSFTVSQLKNKTAIPLLSKLQSFAI